MWWHGKLVSHMFHSTVGLFSLSNMEQSLVLAKEMLENTALFVEMAMIPAVNLIRLFVCYSFHLGGNIQEQSYSALKRIPTALRSTWVRFLYTFFSELKSLAIKWKDASIHTAAIYLFQPDPCAPLFHSNEDIQSGSLQYNFIDEDRIPNLEEVSLRPHLAFKSAIQYHCSDVDHNSIPTKIW